MKIFTAWVGDTYRRRRTFGDIKNTFARFIWSEYAGIAPTRSLHYSTANQVDVQFLAEYIGNFIG